ncbi:hypothetical protein ACPA54_33300 [Uniformispora flossi]|uniref:hypothetical protein n=1 Tax=Uniformispora flossi TaxID=3390723 RepID=UPI003C2AE03B
MATHPFRAGCQVIVGGLPKEQAFTPWFSKRRSSSTGYIADNRVDDGRFAGDRAPEAGAEEGVPMGDPRMCGANDDGRENDEVFGESSPTRGPHN